MVDTVGHICFLFCLNTDKVDFCVFYGCVDHQHCSLLHARFVVCLGCGPGAMPFAPHEKGGIYFIYF